MNQDEKKLLKKLASAEEALKLTEKKFKFLFDYSSDEIFVSDLKGNFLEVNRVAYEGLGYTRDEILEMNFKLSPRLLTGSHGNKIAVIAARLREYKGIIWHRRHVGRSHRS